MRPLFYLALHNLLNSIKRIPRNPRLLIPILFFGIVIASQIAVFVLSRRMMSDVTAELVGPFSKVNADSMIASIRGLLLLSVFTSVISAMGEGNIVFTPSDSDFLFCAPIRRRSVLFYKMVDRYLILLLTAAYLPIFMSGYLTGLARLSIPAFLPGVLGNWLFLIGSNNLATAVLLQRDRRNDDDAVTERRKRWRTGITALFWLVFGGGGIYLATGGWSNWQDIRHVLNGQAVSLLLAPIAWAADLSRIPFEGWSLAALLRLIGLIALAALSFVILFARERDFYEAAMEFSNKRARAVKAARSGDAGTILSQLAQDGKLLRGHSLPDFGGGARAIVWSDMIAITRVPPRSWLILLLISAAPAFIGFAFGRTYNALTLPFWMFIFLLQMSGLFLLSVRDLLRRADITKAFPIPPMRLLFVELLLSVAQLTVLGFFSLTLIVLLGFARGEMTVLAYITLPTFAALLLYVQTCFVILYPNQKDKAQSTVSGVISLLASFTAFLPSILVGVILAIAHVPLTLIGVAVGGVNLAAAFAALALGAFLWKRFDPTD